MLQRLLRFAYRRLGPRYPRAILVAQFQIAHLILLGGVGLLTLYQSMSDGQFLAILAVGEALVLVENFVTTRFVSCALRPVDPWLAGTRDEATTIAAWRALVDLPAENVRRRKLYPLLFTGLPLSIFATAELGLPASSALIILAGAAVVGLYGLTLRFFAMELSMRPVLDDVAAQLPDGAQLGRAGVSLRRKLLAGLPIINIITGVTVAGLSTGGNARLSDLGVDVLVAVIVAFTISLELSLLLSRSILGPIQELRQATARVGRGDLSVRVPVVSADEAGALAQSFNAAVAGLDERVRLRDAFGAFVDPHVADMVLRDGRDLAQEVEVSVLFLDIRDFTAFAERSSAREVVDRLNEFYGRVVPVLTSHGGHANKFIGDGLLGVFGAPDPRPDHADCAVAAALGIAELVRERYCGELGIGIGVNSGPVLAGTIGGGGRVEFTVIGDAVNTASRVEQVTRVTGDQVLITEATRCLLRRDAGEWVERPSVPLKGKREQVRLWAPAATAGREGASVAAATGAR